MLLAVMVSVLALTVRLMDDEVLPLKLESPAYTAVMLAWVPTAIAVVEKVAVAVRPLPLSVPVPRVVAPSMKVTVPEGVFEPAEPVTVAVKVMLSP